MKQNISLRLTAVLAAMALMVASMPAGASGVTVTLNDNSGTSDAGNGGQTEIDTSFVTSGFYVTSTTLTLTISPAATSTIIHCATPDFLFTTTHTLTAATSSWTSSSAVYSFNGQVPTGTGGTVCLSYGLGTTPQNYSIAIYATSDTTAFTTTDFGAALYYVAGGNVVTVTAAVPATISFAIRNSADSANTNVCQLGTLSTAAVNFCSYRLRIATNAANGFTATIQPSGALNAAGAATMTAITNDVAFATGTEAYGLAFLNGATSGGRSGITGFFDQPVTEAGTSTDASLTFSNDSTPLDFTSATTIISYVNSFAPASSPSPTTTTLVVHGATIGAGTESGSYSQTVTYRVTGSF